MRTWDMNSMNRLRRGVHYTSRLTREFLYKFGNRSTELEFIPVGFDDQSVTVQLVFTSNVLIAEHPIHLRLEVLDGIKDILTEMLSTQQGGRWETISQDGVYKWIIYYGN